MCARPLHACCSGTCRRTNESLTFPVNCGFMVYRRTAETFYWPAMRDNAALTAECPGQNESSEYTRDAYAGNVFPRVLYLFLPFFLLFFRCFAVLRTCLEYRMQQPAAQDHGKRASRRGFARTGRDVFVQRQLLLPSHCC